MHEDLIKRLRRCANVEFCYIECPEYGTSKCQTRLLEQAADAIEQMVKDYRPVVHGKWTLNKDGSGTCSECGRKQHNCWDLDNWDNYCHFCGADMR